MQELRLELDLGLESSSVLLLELEWQPASLLALE